MLIKSLISTEGLHYMLTSMVTNFTEFKPLGLVLGMMLGIGLAEKVGLLETVIRRVIYRAPKSLVTYILVLVGILGNIASDAAWVIIPPLGAIVFYSIGRHPLAGLAAGFASAGAGFTANFIVAGTDALLSGITTEVAQSIDQTIVVTPVDNWYFMSVSVLVLTIVGGLITDRLIEPSLGVYQGTITKQMEDISPQEVKGLRNAGIVAFGYILLLVTTLMFPGSPLRNEEGGIIPSPFLDGIIPIILLFFITVGVTYGVTVKKIKSSKDIPKYMGEAMQSMSGYIVLIFAAAQFIAYFNWSNLGIWIAVNGAEFLSSIELTGVSIIIGYILFTAFLGLLITSGSSKWALEAPIFVPMFMLLNYHPAFIQAAYRIADSSVNIITPLNPYIVLILAFMREYDKKAGLGTLISLMLPYSLIFLIVWLILLIVFTVFGIPFGPGVGMYMNS